MNIITRIIFTLLIFGSLSCRLLGINFEATTQQRNDVPVNITGVDRDLWNEFVHLSNLPNCQLPCWWGLEIGEVKLQEVLDFVQEKEFDRIQREDTVMNVSPEEWITYNGYSLEFTGRGTADIGDVDFFFSFDDTDLMQTIYLTLRSPYLWLPDESNPLLISNVLNDVETSPTVLVSTSMVSRISDFEVILIYSQEKFQIEYRVDISEYYPLICLNSENIRDLSLKITEIDDSFVKVSDVFVPVEGSWLTQDSSITTEEFVQFFRDNPDRCLDLSQYP